MKAIRIVRKHQPWEDHGSTSLGCDRIVRCFRDRGLHVTKHEAYEMWTMFSESVGGFWERLDETIRTDEQIMFCLQQYYEVLGEYLGEERWISHP
jgi:hypothetical protein